MARHAAPSATLPRHEERLRHHVLHGLGFDPTCRIAIHGVITAVEYVLERQLGIAHTTVLSARAPTLHRARASYAAAPRDVSGGNRLALQTAILADDIRAHAEQWWRIDVQGHRRVAAGVAHAVDVRCGEEEAKSSRLPVPILSLLEPSSARRSSRTQPLTTETAPQEMSWS